MSLLRRLMLGGRLFFVTCRLWRGNAPLGDPEFERRAGAVQSRRADQGFGLTAWVFLPDHWHAILFPRCPATIPQVMESIKVSSTRQINGHRGSSGRLWPGRFFDRALRTVKEYHETVEYIPGNPVKAGLVKRPEAWRWSSVHDYRRRQGAGGPAQPNPGGQDFAAGRPADTNLNERPQSFWNAKLCATGWEWSQ